MRPGQQGRDPVPRDVGTRMTVQQQHRRACPAITHPQNNAADIDTIQSEACEHLLRHQDIIPADLPSTSQRGGSNPPIADLGKLTHLPLGGQSELARPVDVRAVFDGDDGDKVLVIVYAVDHPIVAPSGAVQSLQAELEGLAHPVRAFSQRAVEELDDRRRDFLGEPGQCAARCCSPGDGKRSLGHWPEARRRASSLLSTVASPALSSARLSRISARRAALSMMSSVSSSDSRSSMLMTTAAGCPCLVMITRTCSRSRRSTTSESRFFTAARGIWSDTDMATSIATRTSRRQPRDALPDQRRGHHAVRRSLLASWRPAPTLAWDQATTWATREAQYDAVCTWESRIIH